MERSLPVPKTKGYASEKLRKKLGLTLNSVHSHPILLWSSAAPTAGTGHLAKQVFQKLCTALQVWLEELIWRKQMLS